MAEPSNTNPEKIFSFKIPAIKLKHAIESLRDSDFNPEGVGIVEVTEKKFEITAQNMETEVVGYLCLNTSGLIDFHYCSDKSFDFKIIDLNQISEFLLDASDDDSITIFHLDGSTNLSFSFGSDPIRELNVELVQMDGESEQLPEFILFCEAIVLSDEMREMINLLETVGKDKLVSMDISERFVSVIIGDKPWVYKYDSNIVGTRGMTPGQRHHAWFRWPHLESLKKAASLVPGLLICFLTDPEDCIMMRFNLRELGDLVFIIKAAMIMPNCDQVPLGAGAGAVHSSKRTPYPHGGK